MSARATRKRARVESEDALGNAESSQPLCLRNKMIDEDLDGAQVVPPKERDVEFWLEDGTVIVHARDVEFRVYAGILGAQFPRLKDLFARPNNPSLMASMPGGAPIKCPVVSLEDSPEDLRHIFRAYMSGVDLFKLRAPSFHATSACIRLGLKYGNINMTNFAVAYLQEKFPKDMNKWHNLKSFVPIGFAREHAIGVVNLARLTGELALLPSAFLGCLDIGPLMARGFVREDGTRETLTTDDLACCIGAARDLREASLAAILRILSPSSASKCKNDCKGVLVSALTRLEEHLGPDGGRCIPLLCAVHSEGKQFVRTMRKVGRRTIP